MIDLGNARILTRRRVVAGEYTTVKYRFTVEHPIDDTGFVMVTFRFVGDFGTPQFKDPSGPDYCNVKTDGNCRLEVRWDPKGYIRPWGRTIIIKIMGGFLERGDQINIVFG